MGADATIVQAAYAAAMANVPGDYGEIYKYKAEQNLANMKSVTDFFETQKKEAEEMLQPLKDIIGPSLQAVANDEAVGSDRLYDFLEGEFEGISIDYEAALKSKDKKLQRKLLGKATKLKNQYAKGAESLLTVAKMIDANEINEAQTGADNFLALKEITDFSNGNPNVNYSTDEVTNELIYEVTVPDPSDTDPDATKVIKIGANDIEKLVVTKARDKETALTTLNNTGKTDGLKGIEYTDKDIKKIEYSISENVLNNKNDYLDLIDRGLEGGVPFKKALGDALDNDPDDLTYKELGAVLAGIKTPDTTDDDDKMVITDIGDPGINKEDFDVNDPIGKANKIALASVLTDGGNPLFAKHGYPAGKKLASRYYAEEVRSENGIGFKAYKPKGTENGNDDKGFKPLSDDTYYKFGDQSVMGGIITKRFDKFVNNEDFQTYDKAYSFKNEGEIKGWMMTGPSAEDPEVIKTVPVTESFIAEQMGFEDFRDRLGVKDEYEWRTTVSGDDDEDDFEDGGENPFEMEQGDMSNEALKGRKLSLIKEMFKGGNKQIEVENSWGPGVQAIRPSQIFEALSTLDIYINNSVDLQTVFDRVKTDEDFKDSLTKALNNIGKISIASQFTLKYIEKLYNNFDPTYQVQATQQKTKTTTYADLNEE